MLQTNRQTNRQTDSNILPTPSVGQRGQQEQTARNTDPVDELKDQVEFPSSSERLTHLDNVLVFETTQQTQFTKCRVTHVLIVYPNSRAGFSVSPNTLYVTSGTISMGQMTQPTASKH